MLYESWVTSAFRVINFAVLVGLAYYLYKRYFKNRIDDKMTQKEALLKGLEEQGYFLEGKAHDLEMQLKEQEITGNRLKEKMQDWTDAVTQEHHKYQEEQRIFAAKAAARVQKKNELLAQQVLQKEILPPVLTKAHNELVKQFDNGVESKQYVHTIIQRLSGS